MKKTAFIVISITVISKILGFLREIVFSYFYGASAFSDAYLISISIPNLLFSFVAAGISTAFIPIYNDICQRKSEKAANLFTNNLINIIILLTTFVVFLVFFFTEETVGIFAKGFTGETLELAIYFTRVSIFGIYATLLYNLYSSFLRIKNDCATPSFAGFPLNVITIISIVISAKTNKYFLTWGSTIAIFSQLILILLSSYKKGYKYKLFLNFKDKNIGNLFLLSMPIILSSSINSLNMMIDRTIASEVAKGGISALNYATRLNGFVQGLFVVTIVTIMFPEISKKASNNNFEGIKKTVAESIILILLAVVPASLGLLIFPDEIVSLLFARGAFDSNALSMTSSALFYYSLGMFATAMTEILARVFYAMKDTVTPVKNSLIAIVINIVLNIVLSKYMGIGGLALATSIAGVVAMILMFYSFRKKFGHFGFLTVFKETIKMFIAALLMAIIAKSSYKLFLTKLGANASLIIAILIAVIFYSFLVILFKVKEVNNIINGIKRRLILTKSQVNISE